ncbi:hypothetical protein HK105_204457 [Polyrhizophydium stewartii]|uniref:Rab-GAP TBC domain-containing protein n=1 Tax=Polyrhizophydium stewartii TaxID=2732419 RepID=A0ABR4N925_9FUNG
MSSKRAAWDRIVRDPLLSTDFLRDKGLAGAIGADEPRSLFWKIYFDIVPSISTDAWRLVLDKERRGYAELKDKFIFDPAKIKEAADWSLNNPLSLAEDSPWRQYFDDMELRKLIMQDVERTLPDQERFRDPDIQTLLCNILFVWCKVNPDISYRQGMHELLAITFIVVDRDKVSVEDEGNGGHQSQDSTDSAATQDPFLFMFDSRFVEHDTATIFFRIMRSIKTWYEINETPSFFARPKDKLQARVVPVIATCRRIQGELLLALDAELSRHLETLGIEPQLYGLRWLRLLFMREFPLEQALVLWDGLFAEDSSLALAEWVAVAMLIYVRAEVLKSDFAMAMHILMKYPPLDGVPASEFISSAKGLRDRFHAKSASGSRVALAGDNSAHAAAGHGSAAGSSSGQRPKRTASPWTSFEASLRQPSGAQRACDASAPVSAPDSVPPSPSMMNPQRRLSQLPVLLKLIQERDQRLIEDLSAVLERLHYWRDNTAATPAQDIEGLTKMIDKVTEMRRSLSMPLSSSDEDIQLLSQRASEVGSIPAVASAAGALALTSARSDPLQARLPLEKAPAPATASVSQRAVAGTQTSAQAAVAAASKPPVPMDPLRATETVRDRPTPPPARMRRQSHEAFEALGQTQKPQSQSQLLSVGSGSFTEASALRISQGADIVLGQVRAGIAGAGRVLANFFEEPSALGLPSSGSAGSTGSISGAARPPAAASRLLPMVEPNESLRDINVPTRQHAAPARRSGAPAVAQQPPIAAQPLSMPHHRFPPPTRGDDPPAAASAAPAAAVHDPLGAGTIMSSSPAKKHR